MTLLEKMARAMCKERGLDPDEIVPATGWEGAERIPRWHKDREWAARFIAAWNVMFDLPTPTDDEQPSSLSSVG